MPIADHMVVPLERNRKARRQPPVRQMIELRKRGVDAVLLVDDVVLHVISSIVAISESVSPLLQFGDDL
ncbi:MAG: hypothetical protein OXK79_07490 [Chloroflexota bacterium]|nr:hypothetical protein [Chloroflexota bacterium]